MARSMSTDPLQKFRFHVNAVGVNGEQKLAVPGRPQAGFTSCSAPQLTATPVTYKEGQFVYEQKLAGVPQYNDITMSRGIIRNESVFWNWMLQVIEGSGEYRADVAISHFHRDTSLLGVAPVRPSGTANFTQLSFNNPAFTYQLFEAFPSGQKLADDFGATESNVSMTELTLSYEYINLIEGTNQ